MLPAPSPTQTADVKVAVVLPVLALRKGCDPMQGGTARTDV